jgi:hypothetical protein
MQQAPRSISRRQAAKAARPRKLAKRDGGMGAAWLNPPCYRQTQDGRQISLK